jgi:leucyl aminopeptidase
MSPQITAAPAVPDDAEVVGVPVAKGLQVLAGEVDVDALRARGFEGKVGETAELDGVVAVGVGEAAEVDAAVIRRATAAFVKATSKRGTVASLLLDAVPAEVDRGLAAQAAAEGAALAAYRFTKYKSEPGDTGPASVVLVGKGGRKVANAAERGAAVAEAVAFARDLVNTPPGDLTPVALAKAAVAAAEAAGITVEVIDEKQARKQGLGGLVGVGQGSTNPPRLVKLTYEPEGTARGTLALVGKGITFDSGGLSIKTSEGMMTMKGDMSGAAAVLAAMTVLPATAPRVRVVGYLCAAENMPSGAAIRPGDVLRISNGKTVEVLNTDAEGRLVLADGLAMAVAEGADAIVDVATLTGACVVALGGGIAGLMTNHEAFGEQVQAAADRAGEQVWPLPLPQEYRKQLDSEVADLKNIGAGRYGGALTAGLFLQEFVDGVPWAHLDIAGPAFAEDTPEPYVQKGGTGFGVRTLVALADSFRKPRRSANR